MILALIISAVLSLSSTNEYHYVNPGTTNIVGKGMGSSGTYIVPRAEDIAFLKEAYTERARKLGMSRSFAKTNSLAFAEKRFRSWSGENLVKSLFMPSYGKWNRSAYDNYAYIVNPSINWPENWFWETDQRYLVAGVSSDPTNGLTAFLPFNAFAIPASSIKTNIDLVGIVSRRSITNAYANLSLNSGILDTSSAGFESPYIASRFIRRAWREDDVITKTGFVSYNYYRSEGHQVTGTYPTSYTVARNTHDYVFTNVEDVTSVSLSKIYRFIRTQPIAVRNNDYTANKRFTVLKCGSHFDTRMLMEDSLYFGGPMRLSTFCLITNEVSNATCMAVIRFKIVLTETIDGSSSRAGTSSTEEWRVATLKGNATRLPGDSTKWETDMDVVHAIWEICGAEEWIDAVRPVDVEFEDGMQSDVVPNDPWTSCSRRVRIVNLEVFPYIHFVHNFRARVIQE